MRLRTPAALVGILLVALLGGSAGTALAAPASRSDGPVVVVRGLNNPRQLSVTPLGNLLVAEAGAGGSQCYPDGPTTQCVGATGSISMIPFPSVSAPADPVRLVTGLLSFASPGGFEAFGPSGVASAGVGRFYFVQPGKPAATLPPGIDTSGLEKLMLTRVPGGTRTVADLKSIQQADTNPYAVLALPDGVLVADAHANNVVRWHDGRLSVFTALPNLVDGSCATQVNEDGSKGCHPVPTGLAVGPDGSIYVAGFGGPVGFGRVYVLDRHTGRITREITGLTGLNGVTVGPDGSVYASQLYTRLGPQGPDFTTGMVTRVRPDGSRTDTPVPAPAGLAVIGHCLYVSAWTTSPAGGQPGQPDSSGQIWRLRI